MGTGRCEVDVVAGEFPSSLPLLKKSQRLVLIFNLSFDQVLNDGVLLDIVSDLKVLGDVVPAQQINDVFVVDLEVTNAYSRHHAVPSDPVEDLPSRQGNQP